MRVGIDASNLRAGGGVTHLAALLGATLPERHGITRIVVWSGRATLDQLPQRPWLTLAHEPALDRGLASRLWWQRLALARRAVSSCDVLFVPGGSYAGGFRPFVTMSRSLLPFQDSERRRYGISAMALRLALLRFAQTSTCRRANGVIFLNAYARDTVLAVSGPLAGASAVVPHGVDSAFFCAPRTQPPPSDFNPDRPWRVLYVSTIDLYKHQWHVADAVATLRSRGIPASLELVGAAYPPALARLRATLARVDAAAHFVRYAGPQPHAALPGLYRQADAFVFASSCENMPNILLEAMAAGLPIACADRGPMPSVLGNAGLYFDPENPESLAAALERLFRERELRARLAARAHTRARAYSWEQAAEHTWTFVASVQTAGAPSPIAS